MMSYKIGSTTTSYKYNWDGIRTTKTVGSTTTKYFLDGSTILAQQTGSNTIPFYYDANGKRIAFKYNGDMYYYVYNLQGDVTHIMKGDKTIVGTYQYDAWGKILNLNSLTAIAKVNPFRYRGYYYDTESNLYYLNSRYYNPEWGRFINADGQLIAGSNATDINLFAYCSNNPTNRVDSEGQAWYHWAIGAAIVVGCGVATVVTCGGFAAAAGAICMVGSGMAAATTASTVAAGAFIGSATVYGVAAITAAGTSSTVKEFNSKGNWGTVAATAGGAIVGGASAYTSSRSSSSFRGSGATKPKVSASVSNDLINLPRTGSALKTDAYHAFSNIVDNYAGYATKTPINNGTLYQLQGSLNGVAGRFEWIVQNQQVMHRMFVPGGGINGIPIMP